MMSRSFFAFSVVTVTLMVSAILGVTSPLNIRNPSRDAGVYLYVGSTILAHEIPYRDVWDHKPPAIHYVNALGLFLGLGSPWGVWALEAAALFLAVILAFAVYLDAFGGIPAFFSCVAWLTGLALTLPLSGNLTEEFVLPLQFGALRCFWKLETGRPSLWRVWSLGALAAVALLFKPNVVGLWVAVVAYWSLQLSGRVCLVRLAVFTLGIFSVLAAVLFYFAANHAAFDLFDQVFAYNRTYMADPAKATHLEALIAGLGILASSGTSVIAILSWLTMVVFLWRRDPRITRQRPMVFLLVFALPIELVFVSLPGHVYEHYYTAQLPAMAGLSAAFAFLLLQRPADPEQTNWAVLPQRSFVLLGLLIAAMLFSTIRSTLAGLRTFDSVAAARVLTARYIEKTTRPEDFVLMWGAETSVNFLAHRRSPSRYVYQYALYMRGYSKPWRILEFFRNLRAHSPVVIVDTSSTNDLIPPIELDARKEWAAGHPDSLDPAMNAIFEEISSKYFLEAEIRPLQWRLYRLASS